MTLKCSEKLEKSRSFPDAAFEPGDRFLRGFASRLAVEITSALLAPLDENAVQHLKLDRAEQRLRDTGMAKHEGPPGKGQAVSLVDSL
jgi:hypothetical protein